MWTPRRVALLVAGFVACVVTFGAYYRFLGWIDGLPTLPEKYLAVTGNKISFDVPIDEPKMQSMLKQAFGERCRELDYPIKLNVQAQEILLATDDFAIEPDGRLKLTPFSVAIMKNKADGTFPEIHTIHCDVAYVTFDRKIETLSDMAKGKVVAAEFLGDATIPGDDPRKGSIYVVGNHATPQTDDDLVIKMPGPLYFRDRVPGQAADDPQLWTRSFVDISDYSAKPTHRITAQGMNIFMIENAVPAPDRPAAKTGKSQGQIVKKLELMSNVHMILTLEDQSSFPAGDRPAEPQRQLPPDQKPILTITTLGPFRYDLEKDLATFEVAPASERDLPQFVEAVRSSKALGNDTVKCDHLEVQFRKKSAAKAGSGPPPAANNEMGGALEISEATATGKQVILTSDSEKLHAIGNSLSFNQANRTNILRGLPLTAIRDGNKIQALELELRQVDALAVKNATDEDPVTVATAKGPGTVWLLDRDNQRTVEVRWTDDLKVDRWPEMDRIHLTGGAAFEDREHNQLLQGDQIKLWLLPNPAPAGPVSVPPPVAATTHPASGGGGFDQSRAKPRHVRAISNVRAVTPELRIDRTVLLDIWFQDVPALAEAKPGIAPNSGLAGLDPVPPKPVGPPPAATAQGQAPAGPPQTPQPAQKPFEVSAQVIEATILRAGARNELDRVLCHERVVVHQDSAKPGERGLDLASQELTLTHTPDGDILELNSKRPALAKVESQQLNVYGYEIVFNQKDNTANVHGPGNMKMSAATTLSGEARPSPVPINIFWNDRMEFKGDVVMFFGGVQAIQEGTKVLCPKMDVILDRIVSLKGLRTDRPAAKPGGEDDQPKIRKVFCHNGGIPSASPVVVTDETYEKNRLVKYQRIIAPEVNFDNEQGLIRAPGRGEVRMLQPGEKSGADPLAKPAPTANPNAPAETEMKLTQIEYDDRLEFNTKLHTGQFYRNIRTLYVPTENPNLVVNPNKLPPGAFFLRCDRLEVASNQTGGQSMPSMVADGHADVESREFKGSSDKIKYDEGRDKQQQVIFEGSVSAPAMLEQYSVPGGSAKKLQGRTIYYWRKTNQTKVVGAIEINGSQ